MAGPELGISLMSRLYCLMASSVRRITPAPASMPVILPSKSLLYLLRSSMDLACT
ncbi:hypothetical protein D3C81_2224410 [compost metagenome]